MFGLITLLFCSGLLLCLFQWLICVVKIALLYAVMFCDIGICFESFGCFGTCMGMIGLCLLPFVLDVYVGVLDFLFKSGVKVLWLMVFLVMVLLWVVLVCGVLYI